MAETFTVRLTAGSLRAEEPTFVLPHAWTDGGVAVEGEGTGAHLFHAAVAVCVLNDVFREARAGGLDVEGVAVSARGGFTDDWASTGVTYEVAVDGVQDDAAAALLARVDDIAEIPRAMRTGTRVVRARG